MLVVDVCFVWNYSTCYSQSVVENVFLNGCTCFLCTISLFGSTLQTPPDVWLKQIHSRRRDSEGSRHAATVWCNVLQPDDRVCCTSQHGCLITTSHIDCPVMRCETGFVDHFARRGLIAQQREWPVATPYGSLSELYQRVIWRGRSTAMCMSSILCRLVH